jgi:hypothetical protein
LQSSFLPALVRSKDHRFRLKSLNQSLNLWKDVILMSALRALSFYACTVAQHLLPANETCVEDARMVSTEITSNTDMILRLLFWIVAAAEYAQHVVPSKTLVSSTGSRQVLVLSYIMHDQKLQTTH